MDCALRDKHESESTKLTQTAMAQKRRDDMVSPTRLELYLAAGELLNDLSGRHTNPDESFRGILTRNYGGGEEAVPIDIARISERVVA